MTVLEPSMVNEGDSDDLGNGGCPANTVGWVTLVPFSVIDQLQGPVSNVDVGEDFDLPTIPDFPNETWPEYVKGPDVFTVDGGWQDKLEICISPANLYYPTPVGDPNNESAGTPIQHAPQRWLVNGNVLYRDTTQKYLGYGLDLP
jgi:hypothetical protein